MNYQEREACAWHFGSICSMIEEEENNTVSSFKMCSRGGVCGTQCVEEKCILGFGGEI